MKLTNDDSANRGHFYIDAAIEVGGEEGSPRVIHVRIETEHFDETQAADVFGFVGTALLEGAVRIRQEDEQKKRDN